MIKPGNQLYRVSLESASFKGRSWPGYKSGNLYYFGGKTNLGYINYLP
jgi:hypothetical protein